MKLSIIIPVYNEEKTLKEIINKVEKVNLKKLNLDKEIIIVDDASTDNSKKIIKKLRGKYIKIFHNKNQGKGTAIRTALSKSSGDIIIIQDADLEYDPEDYPKLLEPILSKKTKVVYGSRFLNKKFTKDTPLPLHLLGNLFLNSVTRFLFFTNISDMETCYKVFTREVIKDIKLKAKRFDFEPEITAKILKRGFKIYEIPINYKNRGFDQGKKITWRDGLKAVYYLIKYRFFD